MDASLSLFNAGTHSYIAASREGRKCDYLQSNVVINFYLVMQC